MIVTVYYLRCFFATPLICCTNFGSACQQVVLVLAAVRSKFYIDLGSPGLYV